MMDIIIEIYPDGTVYEHNSISLEEVDNGFLDSKGMKFIYMWGK